MKFATFIGFLLIYSTFEAHALQPPPRPEEKYIDQEVTKIADSYIPALKHPVSIWAEVGLLYFSAEIKSMQYTTKAESIDSPSSILAAPLVDTTFSWQPGFEVGIGYIQPKKKWDLTFRGMHFHSGTSSSYGSMKDSTHGIFPIWSLSKEISSSDYCQKASMQGSLSFDRLCLQAGYFAEITPYFVMKGLGGIEVAFIKQSYHLQYRGGVFINGDDIIFLKNNFFGAGPQIGIQPWVSLGKGFSCSGVAALSWLYGIFTLRQNEEYLKQERYNYDEKKHRGNFATDLKASIQWKKLFYHDRFSFSTRLSYEYLVYFHQNQLQKDQYNRLKGGGVQLQGFILAVLFDF